MSELIVKIKDIMVSPPTNSGLKKSDVILNKLENEELVPVYSASKDENAIFGWVKIDSKWKKYENMLTWNKDGSAGIVFYRKNKFVPYEKVKLLKIKEEFSQQLFYPFLKIIIEKKLLSKGFDFGNKCSMEKVMEMEIEIPTLKNNNFDLEKQKKLAEKYERFYNLKNNLKIMYKEFSSFKIKLDDKYKIKEFLISDLFFIEKGNAKYTKAYFRANNGAFPVYSSQTTNDGEIGKINSYDYDTECLTWTTDGIYAGTIFYRENKFSMTTHCGALILKDEYKEKIDLKYIQYQLNLILQNYATGEGNKRITVKIMEKIPINIIINESGGGKSNACVKRFNCM